MGNFQEQTFQLPECHLRGDVNPTLYRLEKQGQAGKNLWESEAPWEYGRIWVES